MLTSGEETPPSTMADVGYKTEVVVDADASPSHAKQSYILTGIKLVTVIIGFILSFTLIALDQTILSTALATIVSDFNAVSDLTWIASAYFVPQAGLMLLVGRILTIAPAKYIYLGSIAMFEVGSLICALSPSVEVLIFGRAVCGVGAAGLWIGVMSILAQITTIQQRPMILSLFGAVFAFASIVGPLIGGAFSDHVSWRWCFWINLPCGGVAILMVLVVLPNIPAPGGSISGWRKWLYLDWIGAILDIALVTCLLIPLQWGGITKPWNDPAIISLLVVFGVLTILFVIWEWKQGDNAILPLKMLSDRDMPGACLHTFFNFIAFIIVSYFLPLLYQVQGHSATKAGILILPFMASGIFTSTLAGGLMMAFGYVWPFIVFGPMLAAIAFGLVYTITPDSRDSLLFGYQVLLGLGIGCATQTGVTIAQAQYHDAPEKVPQATSIATFATLLGNSIGLAISSSVFGSILENKLNKLDGLPPDIVSAVKTSVRAIFSLPADQQAPVITAYTLAIVSVFLIGVPASAITSISALLVKKGKIITKGVAPSL